MKHNVFLRCMLRYSIWFLLELLMAYILAFVVVEGNTLIGAAIDEMLEGQKVHFKNLTGSLLIYTVIGFGSAFLKSIAASGFSLRVQTRYKNLVAEKLYRLEFSYFDENGSATMINKMNSDIAETDTFLNETFLEICTSIVSIITYSLYIGRLNFRLLCLMLLCYPLILFFTNSIVKKIVTLKKIHRQKSDLITEIAQDCMSGILVLRTFGAETYFQEKLNQAADALVDNEQKRTRISNTALIIRKILQWIPNIICAVYAYALVLHGHLSIGSLMAFIMILGRFVEAFVGLPFLLVDAKENIVCVKRVEAVLSEKEESSGTESSGTDCSIAISFDEISFGYSEGNSVLKNMSFQIPIGSTTAFVGDSGGGKSTIFHILCGFYTAEAGNYKLFGRDFKEWDLKAARQNMALVSQNVFLFPATIEENVAYGNPDATKEEIVNACKGANIHEFIMGLPEGYQTMVGERGILLSGGERQRISIARAILKDAPILLLDEPTSAVDVATEQLIQEAIDQLCRNRTCVIIAHRLSTIQNADKIMVVKEGQIAETGNHRELISQNGIYAGMYGKEEDA